MHKHALAVTTAVLFSGALGAVAACSSDTCLDNNTCAAPGLDGGGVDGPVEGGGSDGAPVPPDCDPSADVKDAPACVVDSYGVFVDGANGADANPGTKSSPKKTIGGALSSLGGKPRIYVCGAGPYAEGVKMSGASAASVYGGFSCGSWAHDGTKAKVAPAERGYAVSIANVSSELVLSDVELEAKDGAEPGESSIAAFVVKSARVKLLRVKAKAGTGVDAAPVGTTPTNHFAGSVEGNPATGATGALGKACACILHGSSAGGGGGNAGNPAPDGGAGSATPAVTVVGARTSAGGAGYNDTLGSCLPGRNGSDGSARGGGGGAEALGVVTETGFVPSAGRAGEAGNPGGGGGGGGGGLSAGSGGGGCGGCGGSGGPGGAGGGSSIAVMVFESALSVEASELITAKPGSGAAGGTGEAGGGGGGGGTTGACGGGAGGNGAGGGGGGGGAGGSSVGVMFKGPAPVLDVATKVTTVDKAGVGGGAGAPGSGGSNPLGTAPGGVAGTKGRDGVTAPTQSL